MKRLSFKNAKDKLTFQIPLKIISAVIAIIVVICVILGVNLSASEQESTTKQINYLAQNNAYLASAYLNNMQTISKSLAEDVYRYNSLDAVTRDKMIKSTLDTYGDDKRIFSAFVAFEPNVMIANTPDGLSYYEYKSGTEKKLDVVNNYKDYKDGEYYTVTKSSLKPHITEPYSYKLATGETVWLISISDPILDSDGKFLGVTTTDILTDTINNLTYNVGGYKTSYNYILTGNSNYVTDTSDKTKSGKKFTASDNSGVFKVSQPLTVEGIDDKWTSTFIVKKSEALQVVTSLLSMTALIGLIGILILGLIIFLILKKSLSPIKDIVELSTNMGKGKLDSDISVYTKDELGELALISKSTSKELHGYITEISSVLDKISDGDLRIDVVRDYMGDFVPIKKALLDIISSFNITFSEIRIAAEQVSSGSEQVSNGAQALAQGATEQASSIEELSASITEIATQVKQNSDHATEASANVNNVRSEIEISNHHMNEMVASMSQINESSSKIGKIIKTIEDIAFQTNILALNAAVEAARAGTAGKGFAVVADEVRNLASKSAAAAKDTTALIENSMKQVENGTQIADQTAKSLMKVVESATAVSNTVDQISQASKQQADSISQVTLGVDQISNVVQTNSATAEQSAAASEELSAQSQAMKVLVGKFILKDKANQSHTIPSETLQVKPEQTNSSSSKY